MRRASSAARIRAAGSAPFSPITSSPRSTSAAATWRAAASGIGSTNSGCGANGAVRITTPTGSPVASSATVSHQRGYDGSGSPASTSATARAVTVATTVLSTGSASSSPPARTRNARGSSVNSSANVT